MINPSLIVNAVVAALRDTPEVLRLVGNDPERIYPYIDLGGGSLSFAIFRMPMPGICVTWQGTAPRDAGNFGHDLSLYIRAQYSFQERAPTFANIVTALFNAKPTGQTEKLLNLELLPGWTDPMEQPTVRRIFDEEGSTDLFEMTFTVPEKYDNDGYVPD